jgi:hypothetical protein
MNDYGRLIARERRRRAYFRKRGFPDPKCAICGNTDVLWLEEDHLAGRNFGDETWLVCITHHLWRTDLQVSEHPPVGPNPKGQLEKSRRVILNAADSLELLSRWLRGVGENLNWDG